MPSWLKRPRDWNDLGFYAAWMILLFTVLFCCLSCRTKPDPGPAVGEGISLAKGHVEAAQVNITHAKPHADPIGQEFLGAAGENLGSAIGALSKAQKDDQLVRADCAAAAQRLKFEQDHWFGKKSRDLAKWIIGISLALWIGFGLLAAFLPVGGLGAAIIRFLPAANLFTRLHRMVHPDPAPAIAATERGFA